MKDMPVASAMFGVSPWTSGAIGVVIGGLAGAIGTSMYYKGKINKSFYGYLSLRNNDIQTTRVFDPLFISADKIGHKTYGPVQLLIPFGHFGMIIPIRVSH